MVFFEEYCDLVWFNEVFLFYLIIKFMWNTVLLLLSYGVFKTQDALLSLQLVDFSYTLSKLIWIMYINKSQVFLFSDEAKLFMLV